MKLLLIKFLILALGISLVKARCLGLNQVEICSNEDQTSCKCETCPDCKPGEGLNQECVGLIKGNVTFKCVPCILGVTYSRFNNSGTCQPCPQCKGHLMLSRCTTKRPTKCSPDQCKDGFVWNPVVDNCERLPTPKRTSTTPPPMTTLVTSSTTPLPVTTPVRTSTTTHPTTTALVSTVSTLKLIPKPTQIPRIPTTSDVPVTKVEPGKKEDSNNDTPRQKSSQENNQQHLKDFKNWKKNVIVIAAVVCLVFMVAGVATAIYVCKDRKRRLKCLRCCKKGTEEGGREENVPLGTLEEESTELSDKDIQVQVYPWPVDYKLREISAEIKDTITIGFSGEKKNKVRELIGRELKVESKKLNAVETHAPEDRGLALFDILQTSQPKLTLTRFMGVCAKVKRNDIVEEVKKEYQQSNATFKASIQDVNEGKEDHQEQG